MYTTVSGPEMFGFAHPTIAKLIQELPGAERCPRYCFQTFVPSNVAYWTKSSDKPKKLGKRPKKSDEPENLAEDSASLSTAADDDNPQDEESADIEDGVLDDTEADQEADEDAAEEDEFEIDEDAPAEDDL